MYVEVDFEKIWMYLTKTDETLHIPLIYILIPITVLLIVLIFCCCFFCVRSCCQEPEIHIVHGFVPSVRPRADNSIYRNRTVYRDDEEAGPSGSGSRSGSGGDEACIQLDEDAVSQINDRYKQRNYQVPK